MPYTQEEINYGQKKINGSLVDVDKQVISTLKDILGVVKDIAAVQPVASHLRAVDFSRLEDALERVEYASGEVADINPPGCAAPPY